MKRNAHVGLSSDSRVRLSSYYFNVDLLEQSQAINLDLSLEWRSLSACKKYYENLWREMKLFHCLMTAEKAQFSLCSGVGPNEKCFFGK